ncbi:enoyl-CoA hydratase/isomerase family protein [Pseudorhodoferax soli]|uniref:Enoyl-CoA hydratase/carnithine racemase n=1 Tax=Pseudorhodoferax soli TaxID=545864 RepID=A0A368XKZ7_9BURK|nr:enoyl-CoA hydratase-related protein [Pseudorhodoferax soli]RCW68643.1 enoyl-CoA hydratase/carnithine racemase [Pseudorhodoferax soli]
MTLKTSSVDGVLLITIDRPAQKNALNKAVVQGLYEAWQQFATSDDRVAVLTGEGNDAFSVGSDVHDMPGDIWTSVPNFAVPCNKPIISAVSGLVVGAGATIALYSDIVIASSSSRFVYPEAKVGLFQGVMGGFPKKLTYGPALEWAITGDSMTAQRAYEIGFVNQVCEPGQQVEAAMQLARKVAANAPLVVQSIKSIALKTLPTSPMEAFYPQKAQLERIAQSEDGKEGMRAFAEKRKPQFRGK